MTASWVPILAVDLIGSVLMIVLSFLCLHLAYWLKRQDPENVIWSYLQFLCIGLAGFAVSRSVGHILRQVLVLSGSGAVWKTISPYSGAVNTLMFMFAGAATLFFKNVWRTYRQISLDREALRTAHGELVFLNQNLERMVSERTVALTRSERRYRRIFEISRDIILVTGTEGAILDMNPLGLTTLAGNIEREAIAGRRFGAFFSRARDWEALIRDIGDTGFVTSREVLLRRLDGTSLHALVSGSLDPADGEEPPTIHFLVKDIEALRQMEKQMAQADKLASIGELSAGIAHEINNPLGVILGYTQLLLRRETDDEGRREDLKVIEKHVRNCKAIVEDLLNFARSSPTVREPADLNALVKDVVHFITHHAKMGKTVLSTRCDPRLPKVRIDDKKIRQVIINLVMNALYAVGMTGSIRIDTELAADNRAVIRVTDDGPGIDPVHLPRIFDPFYTTKPTGEGTGLGLSVSYGIITNHGGDIQVESTPGLKTTFRVSLPLEAPADGAPQP